MANAWIVIKVGGSLFDLPDLRERLRSVLLPLNDAKVLLVPGGGAAADAMRALDQVHRLGEEAAHWLAIRTMSLHAHFLGELLPGARIVSEISKFNECLPNLLILDAFLFFLNDEQSPDHLPHSWDVTSDALSVRVATLLDARELLLLKSVAWPKCDWHEAARAGIVDKFFPEAVRRAPESMWIRVVNLRG
jgi:aspartokinase-like uncharacterized kinase